MSDVLDLDATVPPRQPKSMRWPVIGVKMDAALAAFVREQAHVERTTGSSYIRRLIRQARDGQLPADCRDWLTRQAAQCGCPGDPDAALVAVIRHLADRWPDGARLR